MGVQIGDIEQLLSRLEAEHGAGASFLRSGGHVLHLVPSASAYRLSYQAIWRLEEARPEGLAHEHVAAFEFSPGITPDFEIEYRAKQARRMLDLVARGDDPALVLRKDMIAAGTVGEGGDIPSPQQATVPASTFTRPALCRELRALRDRLRSDYRDAEVMLLDAVLRGVETGGQPLLEMALHLDRLQRDGITEGIRRGAFPPNFVDPGLSQP